MFDDADAPNGELRHDDRPMNRGWFKPANTASMTHGGRRSLDRPEALAAIRGKRDELVEHLGGDPSVIQSDLATDYARVDVLIESVAANIEVGGIFTAKGKARAAVSLLQSLMDRRLRLAVALGIERRQKHVNPLDAVRAAVVEANQRQQPKEETNGNDQ